MMRPSGLIKRGKVSDFMGITLIKVENVLEEQRSEIDQNRYLFYSFYSILMI